jgi:cytochrome c oxidase assembly protein subunit 15
MRRRLPTLAPRTYAWIATITLVALILIVFSGAAVRLTGSGLGCPDWPDCHGKFVQTELDSHGAIEYGNRVVTGFVGFAAILAALAAFLRRPFRKDLAVLGILMPLGVIAQAVLGGLSVLTGLAYGWVMGHFLLSMLILAGAVQLAWRAWREPEATPRNERTVIYATRGLAALGAWVLVLGTLSTAAGPHPGSSGTGEVVGRFDLRGGATMDWIIHWHGRFSTFLGLCAVATWFYARAKRADRRVRNALTAVCLLLAAQGIVGFIQYENGLPSEVVWIHVVLATCTWLGLMWAFVAAGRPADAPAPRPSEPAPEREPALV